MTIIGSYRKRRIGVVIIGALATVLMLAGCAAPGDSEPDSRPPSAAADSLLPAAEGKTEYPLTLTSPWGETVLKERAERIAAITQNGLDTELLAALGVTPVIAASTGDQLWVQEAPPRSIDTLYDVYVDPYPLEKIAAARPDLIVAIGTAQITDAYADLTKIAPVLTAETLDNEYGGTWQEEITRIAAALDLGEKASVVITDYETTFEEFRADHPEFENKTVTYVVHYGGEYGTSYYSASGSTIESFFLSLGFAPNPLAEKFTDSYAVSAETLSLLEADVLLLSDNSAGGDNSIEEITASPLFEHLEVVKKGGFGLITNTGDGDYHYNGVEHEGNLAWAIGDAPLASIWAAHQLIPILNGLLAESPDSPR